MNDDLEYAGCATILSQLRAIDKAAWAKVENPNGWTYETNIGHLAHMAADYIEELQKRPEVKQTSFLARMMKSLTTGAG